MDERRRGGGDVVAADRPDGARLGAGVWLACVAAASAGSADLYPVLNEEYATMIARDWSVPASGVGYVTRFQVRRSFLDDYEVHQVGERTILEYWIPAQDVGVLNANIVGTIDVVGEYR